MDQPRIFISYSHHDEEWKDRLRKQLAALPVRLAEWNDRNIKGGEDWESQIRMAMDQANLAVLLVTADFLCSEFITKVEVPRLLERHRAGELLLYPIIVSFCPWKKVDWLRALNCRPKDGLPLVTFFDKTEASGNEQLMMIAEEIADLVVGYRDKPDMPEVPDRPDESNEMLRLLAELVKKSGGVAEPPEDLKAAIQNGLTDVSQTLTELTARSRTTGLELDDIDHVVSTAIGHGAGVYNHSDAGRVGCARIYHRAASGLLELLPEGSPSPDSRPPRNVGLAADWLRRIVMATPFVREPVADDLAWELRWVFDSLHLIPLCDDISDALASLSLTGTARRSASDLLSKVLERCLSISSSHVGVYVLRHTAQVLLSRMAEHHSLDRDLIALWDRLRSIVSAHPRITRTNLAEVGQQLVQTMKDVVETLATEASTSRSSQKRWFDPRVWFSQN